MCNRGFSLIELMVVVAIVGLLSAIAVPAYRMYYAKANLASVIPIMKTYADLYAEKWVLDGEIPNTTTDVRLWPTGIPTGSVTLATGGEKVLVSNRYYRKFSEGRIRKF